MTDTTRVTAPVASVADDAEDLSTVVQRRLVGLMVLLLALFVLSWLLRQGNSPAETLPAVVIPLGAPPAGEPRVLTAPVTESAPEPEPATLPATPEPARERGAVEPAESAEPAAPPTVRAPAEPPKAVAPKPAAAPKPKPKPEPPKPAGPPRWFVAVGAYRDPVAASAIANRVKLAGFKAEVTPVVVNKDKLQRVRAGPFSSQAAAESARATLIVEGLTKAVTVTEK